jgi:hypothetical protein
VAPKKRRLPMSLISVLEQPRRERSMYCGFSRSGTSTTGDCGFC